MVRLQEEATLALNREPRSKSTGKVPTHYPRHQEDRRVEIRTSDE